VATDHLPTDTQRLTGCETQPRFQKRGCRLVLGGITENS